MIILVVFAGGLSVFDCDFRIWRSHIDVVGSYRSLSSLSALVMSHLFTSVNLGGFLFHRLFFSSLPPFPFLSSFIVKWLKTKTSSPSNATPSTLYVLSL